MAPTAGRPAKVPVINKATKPKADKGKPNKADKQKLPKPVKCDCCNAKAQDARCSNRI